MPVRTHRSLILKKLAALAAAVAFTVICLVGGEKIENRYYNAHPEKPRPKRIGKQMPWYGWVSMIIGLGGGFAYTDRLKQNTYAMLRDPMLNHGGCKYQGRVLSTKEPHYLLHLNYYHMHKTWTLPDEIEQSGAFEYENADTDYWALEGGAEMLSSISGER